MSLHSDTDLYRAIAEFQKFVARRCVHLPRGVKGLFGERLVDESLNMMVTMRHANIARDAAKVPLLEELLDRLEIAQAILRVLRELAPDKAVAKLLAEKGIKTRISRDTRKPEKPAKPEDPEKAAKRREQEEAERAATEREQKIEGEYLERLLKLVHEKWKGPMKRDDLELVADYVLDEWQAGKIVGRLYGKRVSPATLNERDLGRLIIAAILGMAVEGNAGPRALLATAKRLKIDTKALEKQVRAELAPKPEGQKAVPAAKAKKKKGKK